MAGEDVLAGWSERFAEYGHRFCDVWPVFLAFAERYPISIREIHSDNGSEFLDQALISRGRLGSKNDSRIVEQKNSGLIRAYLGQLCFDSPAHCRQLNLLYEDMWLYHNFFQPVLRQISRRAVRRQDEAATPLQRLLRAKLPLSRGKAEHLQSLYDDTNPRALRDRIHQHIQLRRQLARDTETLSVALAW